jgi:hypothetical protein
LPPLTQRDCAGADHGFREADGRRGWWQLGRNFHHSHFGIGYVGDGFDNGCFATRLVRTPFGYRVRTINICGY